MNPIAFLRGLFDRGPLLNADKPLWAAAQSLDDLGQLTARWLRGEIKSQPGYYGPVDVDEDDAPGLTDTLVALNLAGFLTDNSQAGYVGPGYDGATWELRAAVTGYADTAAVYRLGSALAGTRFMVKVHKAGRFTSYRTAVPVTVTGGRAVTGFGARLSRSAVAGCFDGCSDMAIDALCDAWQIVVYDPQPGANDLWPVLAAAFTAVQSRTAVTP